MKENNFDNEKLEKDIFKVNLHNIEKNNEQSEYKEDKINQKIEIYKEKIKKDPETKNLLAKIDFSDSNQILSFGQELSERAGRVSDEILGSMKSITIQEATEMLENLTNAMEKFDIKELDFKPKNETNMVLALFNKVFNKTHMTIDSLLSKYENMGKEVGDIHSQLKQFEVDIRKTNADLEKQYETSFAYIKDLEKHIVAGEMAIEEIEGYQKQLIGRKDLEESHKQMQLQKLDQTKEMFSQRIYDLKLSESVAIQNMPLIMNIAMTNFNLLRKINSSISTTLPIFKNCLIQSVQLKRQEIQAKSIEMLDKKTNELLLKNAQNSAKQSMEIAKLSRGSAVDIETIKRTYEIIKNGVEESKKIAMEESQKREKRAKELENFKFEMKQKLIENKI